VVALENVSQSALAGLGEKAMNALAPVGTIIAQGYYVPARLWARWAAILLFAGKESPELFDVRYILSRN
jgi:hypothetical protein